MATRPTLIISYLYNITIYYLYNITIYWNNFEFWQKLAVDWKKLVIASDKNVLKYYITMS